MKTTLRFHVTRIPLLLLGAASATVILTIGAAGWDHTYNNPILLTQVAFLFVVSTTSLLGIAASAFRAEWLRGARFLRRLLVAPSLLFPLNGLFPLFLGSELNRFFVANIVIEGLVGVVVALAIASAWLPAFRVSPRIT